jgi:hypothetical protein
MFYEEDGKQYPNQRGYDVKISGAFALYEITDNMIDEMNAVFDGYCSQTRGNSNKDA